MQSLEHKRAKFAYDKINSIKSNYKEYRSCIMNLGTLILNNGLLATLAFYNTKENHHKEVINWIKEELKNENLLENQKYDDNNEFIKCISGLDTETYILYTTVILSLSNWLKRFADSILKEKEKE
ncbi:MAG: type III-B CRISPR module-associated protein Cmr5 [Candidatus Goldbacteria bacterium]|nr:type III-B CRISPR module-associated protein Cmr5 [Candidatus Goldiibacteriota bacterium]